jgi:hypothetical protein
LDFFYDHDMIHTIYQLIRCCAALSATATNYGNQTHISTQEKKTHSYSWFFEKIANQVGKKSIKKTPPGWPPQTHC